MLLGAVVVWLPIPVSVFGGFYFSYNQYEYVDVHPDCWLLSGEMMKRRRRRRGEGEEEEMTYSENDQLVEHHLRL